MSIPAVGVALASAVASSCRHRAVEAFAPPPISAAGPRHHRPNHQQQRDSAPLGASVYYPDGSVENDYYEDSPSPQDVFGFSSTTIGIGGVVPDLFGRIADHLSSDPAVTSTLARLASAFSPPGFAIDIANVNDVRCLSVDDRHVEIEAVVCDDLECSSLLVPVDFPEACNLDAEGLEACVLRNLHNLEARGSEVLQDREGVFAEEDEALRAFEALQSLESEYLSGPSSSGGALPYWWEPALSSEDVVECDLLEQLLNGDDFNDVMRGLAEHAILHEGSVDLTGRAIRSAWVKALGPAGMVLKVQLSIGGRTYHDDGGLNNEAVVDVPVRFDEMLPSGGAGRSIREEVLSIVSFVS